MCLFITLPDEARLWELYRNRGIKELVCQDWEGKKGREKRKSKNCPAPVSSNHRKEVWNTETYSLKTSISKASALTSANGLSSWQIKAQNSETDYVDAETTALPLVCSLSSSNSKHLLILHFQYKKNTESKQVVSITHYSDQESAHTTTFLLPLECFYCTVQTQSSFINMGEHTCLIKSCGSTEWGVQ